MYFVVKIPLEVSDYNYKKLNSRLEVARVYYNAILAECLKRRRAYRESPEFSKAREIYKKSDKTTKSLADELCDSARSAAGYYLRSAKQYNKDNSVEQYGYREIRKKGTWIAEHLDSHVCLNLTKRAFEAVKRHPKVYFKRYGRDYITSVEGKNLASSLTFRGKVVKWLGLNITAVIDHEDAKHKFIIDHPDKISFVRLSRTLVRNKWHYYAELVCEGTPAVKPNHTLGKGKIGVDVGLSKVDYFNESSIKGTINLAKKVDFKQKQVRKLMRKLDRQRRANNPNNFDEKGRAKKGCKNWVVSNREHETITELRELKRQEKAFRHNLHGQVANLLRSLGDDLYIEKCEYDKWQQNKKTRKCFGRKWKMSRSVTKRAPGLLVNLLRNKFLYTNGTINDIDTYKTKLTQTCPQCGNQKKKQLHEREHKCENCGLVGARDYFSALLAICVNPDTSEINFEEARNYLSREMPTLADEVDGGVTCDRTPTGV